MSSKRSRGVVQLGSEPLTSSSLSSLGIVPFGFHTKTTHDAAATLLQTRSDNYRVLPEIADDDIWKRPPPDFRYIVYEPKPPKRNTVDSIRPWEYGTFPGRREITIKSKKNSTLPLILNNRKVKENRFETRFRIDRPFTARKKFVSEGMYKPGMYVNPKPHDFRQYPPLETLGLEEFVTSSERDPRNLKLKSQRLHQIHGLQSEPPERDLAKAPQMAPPMSKKAKWEAELILDKDDWPPKSAAFTRHRRRNRRPYSAFMELVERHLTAK